MTEVLLQSLFQGVDTYSTLPLTNTQTPWWTITWQCHFLDERALRALALAQKASCDLSQWRHGGPRGTCAAANGDVRGNCGFEHRVILRYKRRSAFWRLGQMGHRPGSTLPAQGLRRSVPMEVGSQLAPMDPVPLFHERKRACPSHIFPLLSNTAPPANATPPCLPEWTDYATLGHCQGTVLLPIYPPLENVAVRALLL